MTQNIKQKGRETTHPISAISLFAVLVFGAIQLKTRGFVGEAPFVSLLTVSGIFGFIVYFKGRIKKAGATGIELHEIKEAENSIKDIASAVLELAESDEDGFKQHGWDRGRYEIAKAQIRKLID